MNRTKKVSIAIAAVAGLAIYGNTIPDEQSTTVAPTPTATASKADVAVKEKAAREKEAKEAADRAKVEKEAKAEKGKTAASKPDDVPLVPDVLVSDSIEVASCVKAEQLSGDDEAKELLGYYYSVNCERAIIGSIVTYFYFPNDDLANTGSVVICAAAGQNGKSCYTKGRWVAVAEKKSSAIAVAEELSKA